MITQGGFVVGMMSDGFSDSITDHYLSLDRLKRVLLALRRGESITRGIIQSN